MPGLPLLKVLDAAAVRAALPFARLIPALRQAFAGDTRVPPRHVHPIAGGTALIMPAWDARYLGIKTINIFPGNGAAGLPALHATYQLYDATTGVPLAQLDGNEITARRTAAASALAAACLAREDAGRLLVLGAGRVARLLPEAHAQVRPIREVLVWNHHADGAERLAAEWRVAGWNARAVAAGTQGLEAAVRQADIVSCATLATAPLVHSEWLSEGSHLDLIGSFTPAMREAAPSCFAGSRVYIDTDEALQKAGDLLDAVAAGTLVVATGLCGTLAGLCRGDCTGRRAAAERTVFKAVGSALEDLAAATLAWEGGAALEPARPSGLAAT